MIFNSKKRFLLEQIKQDADVAMIALRFFEKTNKQNFKDYADSLINRIKKIKKIL